jgi:hypothetical protein
MQLGMQMNGMPGAQLRISPKTPLPSGKAQTTKMNSIQVRSCFLYSQPSNLMSTVAPSTTIICSNRWVENIRLNLAIMVGSTEEQPRRIDRKYTCRSSCLASRR